jgi:hypothetical protein
MNSGETELKLTEFARPRTTWVQLSDSRNNCTNCGDLMFSLSYLPTAERLTVVVVKARSLRAISDENENHAISEHEIQNVYVKVCRQLTHIRDLLIPIPHARCARSRIGSK